MAGSLLLVYTPLSPVIEVLPPARLTSDHNFGHEKQINQDKYLEERESKFLPEHSDKEI